MLGLYMPRLYVFSKRCLFKCDSPDADFKLSPTALMHEIFRISSQIKTELKKILCVNQGSLLGPFMKKTRYLKSRATVPLRYY